MIAMKATYRNGRIEPATPLHYRDGTELEIEVREKDEPLSQAEIDRILAAMDQMVPLQMSDEELAAWEADTRQRKEREKALFFEHARKIDEMWK